MSSWRRGANPPLPPGPMGLPVVGMLPFLDPQLHTYFTRLATTYGPLMSLRLGSKIAVVVSSPSLAKQLAKDFDIAFANHDVGASAKELTYGGNNITFTPYGPEWRMLRKVSVSGLLGPAALDTVYDLRRQCLHKTILHLQENTGYPINIGEQMFLMALSMIKSMLWGEQVMDTKWANDEVLELRTQVTNAFYLLLTPNVSDFFPQLARFDLQGVVAKMRGIAKSLDAMLVDVIDERHKKMDGGCKDFLQFLLQFKDRGDATTSLTMDQLKALLMDMIFGGTETASNTVEFAMLELAKKPEVAKKAQQELEAVVGGGNQVEESHIQQMPYLKAIMKETLRLHPVVPLLVPRCPIRSCIVGGYTIPKGSMVFVNVWSIHRDPLLWEEPLEFKPERFMDKNCEFSGNDFSFLPFGSGRRICVGAALAERIVMLSLASLLHHFDWKLPHGVEELDLSETCGLTLKKTLPLLLIPSPRSSS